MNNKIIIALICLVIGGVIGSLVFNAIVKTDTQVLYIHTIEIPEPRVVEKVVTEIQEIKTPISLSQFSSLEELKSWYEEKRIKEVALVLLWGNTNTDCDDIAMMLVETARSDGKDIQFSFLKKGSYFNNRILTKNHAFGLSIIRNDVYLIDALSGEISLEAYID